MERGTRYSAIFHGTILVLAIFGLPDFLSPDRPLEPSAISVEILPISSQTNVPNRIRKSEVKKPEPKKPEPPKKEIVKPQPPTKQEPMKPEPVVQPKPDEKKKEEKQKEKEKEKPKEKPKKEVDDLDAILKSVKETAQKEETSEETSPEESDKPSKSDTAYIDSLPLSMSEKDAIRSQIAKCWSPPMGAKDAYDLAVILRVTYQQDGSLINVYLHKSQSGRYNSDTFFRSAVDSAMRAVRACTPLQGMPPEKYDSWKDVELNFDPKEMLY